MVKKEKLENLGLNDVDMADIDVDISNTNKISEAQKQKIRLIESVNKRLEEDINELLKLQNLMDEVQQDISNELKCVGALQAKIGPNPEEFRKNIVKTIPKDQM